jgi:hypothetical protein
MTRILPLNETTDPTAVGDQAIVYAKDVGGVTRSFVRNSDGSIVPLSGSGMYALPEVWAYPNVAASLTAVVVQPQVSGFATAVRMARDGSIVGLVAQLSEAITAGQLTINITKNGTPITFNAVLTSGTGAQATQAHGIDNYVAGDLIGVTITTDSGFLPVTTDLEVWVQVSEGGASGGGGGGGLIPWVAGSYQAGQQVMRGPYTWAALANTSEDPLIVEGNLGNNADWTFQTGGTPGTTQTSGASDGAPDGKILLINNATGSSATAYRQRVENGFLGKMIAVDLRISGSADWFHFGIYDSSLAQTFSNINFASSGFYGFNINIFNNQIENYLNGQNTGTPIGYVNGNAVNAGSAFTRWYMKMIQNGSNWDIELLRHAWDAAANNGILPYTAFSRYQQDDLVPIARFINVARPSFTNWRFVIGARTGGSAGIFEVRAAYTRNIISGAWRATGRMPTQLG